MSENSDIDSSSDVDSESESSCSDTSSKVLGEFHVLGFRGGAAREKIKGDYRNNKTTKVLCI